MCLIRWKVVSRDAVVIVLLSVRVLRGNVVRGSGGEERMLQRSEIRPGACLDLDCL